ncbi:3-methylornithyl-N6-L-lysine dehydrogenase PylD [Phosphitispora fastidiosa]|uniref:3-methylornithyl-N6-L-lysine dehydrogenase PylD n=1 Tax=Phosphitispora fastidiosa TaxID=2837202 RepID=UPI001E564C8B|nr:3-methylornithyl-N6-L-lysine dehydrogenase PylD [Phosphitispora fastidiosa]MBU7006089.1 pyrrolysine biosynthesis protein PylD [Phosphitispora fastidiosa]
MTRLYYEIIRDIPNSLAILDKTLLLSTGLDLLGLGAVCAGMDRDGAAKEIGNYSAAVVPVSSGQGIIPGFAEGVNAVLGHIGLNAAITAQTDIGGIGEAFDRNADVIFTADDRKFLALNLNNMSVIDNSRATAAVFVQALAAAALMRGGGLDGQGVLVIGLGPVGSGAVSVLQELGARVTVFDTDIGKSHHFADMHKDVVVAGNIREAMAELDYVIDATPASAIIDADFIRKSTIISCPGVPHGLTSAALVKIGHRLIHDNLPMGVAAMALQSIFKPWD